MKKTFWIGLTAVMIGAASSAFGDAINGSPSAGWQSWSVTDLNENGTPYWDHRSWDGPLMNVGFCLTNTGNCHELGTNAPGALPFWGTKFNEMTDTGGEADGSIYFTRAGSSGIDAAVELTLAGDAMFNEFGWYNASLSHPSCNVIFDGKGPGATAAFLPSASYGFCFVGENQSDVFGTWFTQTADNSEGKGDQHFAVFNGGGGTYWIGVEDLPFSHTDKDYNDFVVKISTGSSLFQTTTPTPEPTTLVLLGSGLLALGRRFSRRLRKP
jgi:hypothetical protein